MEFIARRRKFLINKDLQVGLLCITLGYVLFFFLVMTASLFVPLMVNLTAENGNISKKTMESAQNLIFLHNNFWLPSILCLVSIIIYSIRTSHRIAGPIYRLNAVVDSIKQGILPVPLRGLRKGDYLIKEFSNVSEMVDSLRLKLGDIQTAHKDLENTIAHCCAEPDRASQTDLVNSIHEIRTKSMRLKEKLEYFTIQNDEQPCETARDGAQSCTGTCGRDQGNDTPETGG